MPINIKNAPIKSFFHLKENIEAFHGKEIVLDDNGDHHHYVPHKIYDGSVFDLAEGKKLDNVQQTAWNYLYEDAHGEYHLAEIGIDEALNEHEFHYINKGRQVNSFAAIYDRLHNHEHVEDKGYEINILRLLPIQVTAVWLKGEDHDHEFFIPLAPVNHRFEGGKTYGYDEFMTLLEKASQAALNIQEEPSDDDLTRIEGIGPKAATILNEAGYITFQSIAESTPENLEAVLKTAGSSYNFLDATTWPEQAQLATDGKWQELDQLQDELQGGKRT